MPAGDLFRLGGTMACGQGNPHVVSFKEKGSYLGGWPSGIQFWRQGVASTWARNLGASEQRNRLT